MGPRRETRVEADGRTLTLSNLDKVLYPEAGFTKAGVIDYYRRVAPALLPHLTGRALTLLRFPDGVEAEGFFEKNCPQHRPEWVRTADYHHRSDDTVTTHCVVDDLATLVWLANLAALELHAPMARAVDPDRPTCIVFDLDPGPPAGFADSARIALTLREALASLDLDAAPKASGKKGLHVYLPLNDPDGPDQAAARDFAHAVAEVLARRNPEAVVTRMDKALRRGRVFVDWSQNARHKTTVAVYSLRATPRPAVSAPLTWSDVEAAADTGASPDLAPDAVLDRVGRDGDLFAAVLELRQHLPDLAEGLSGKPM